MPPAARAAGLLAPSWTSSRLSKPPAVAGMD